MCLDKLSCAKSLTLSIQPMNQSMSWRSLSHRSMSMYSAMPLSVASEKRKASDAKRMVVQEFIPPAMRTDSRLLPTLMQPLGPAPSL